MGKDKPITSQLTPSIEYIKHEVKLDSLQQSN